MVLKASGATAEKAATVLVGKGNDPQAVADNLIANGYNSEKVDAFLGNIIAKTETVDTKTVQVAAVAPVANVTENDIAANTAGIEVDADADADVSTAITQIQAAAQPEAAAKNIENSTENMSATQMVTQLKEQGASSVDVLKAATDAGLDMTEVAGAMKEAGFSNMEIATAYIAKASDWATDKTVNVVNCAVQALGEVLSGKKDIGTAMTEIAYEVIVADILATGEVMIVDGDIFSSMTAIQETAENYGIDLEGVNISFENLQEIKSDAIVHVDGGHWITITDVQADTVTAMDNGKEITMTKAEFMARWDGNALVMSQDNVAGTKLNDTQMIEIRGGRGDGGDGGGGGESDGSDMAGGDFGSPSDGLGMGNDGSDMAGGDFGHSSDGLGSDTDGGYDADFGHSNDGLGFGASISNAGQSLSDFGANQGGFFGGLCQGLGAAVSGLGAAVTGIGNAADAAVGFAGDMVQSFCDMSVAGQVATVAGTVIGLAFGIPGLGTIAGLAAETASNMSSGQSFGNSFGNAVDGSMIGMVAQGVGIGQFGNGNTASSGTAVASASTPNSSSMSAPVGALNLSVNNPTTYSGGMMTQPASFTNPINNATPPNTVSQQNNYSATTNSSFLSQQNNHNSSNEDQDSVSVQPVIYPVIDELQQKNELDPLIPIPFQPGIH